MVGRGFGGADAKVTFGTKGSSSVLAAVRAIDAALAAIGSASNRYASNQERINTLNQRIAKSQGDLVQHEQSLAKRAEARQKNIDSFAGKNQKEKEAFAKSSTARQTAMDKLLAQETKLNDKRAANAVSLEALGRKQETRAKSRIRNNKALAKTIDTMRKQAQGGLAETNFVDPDTAEYQLRTLTGIRKAIKQVKTARDDAAGLGDAGEEKRNETLRVHLELLEQQVMKKRAFNSEQRGHVRDDETARNKILKSDRDALTALGDITAKKTTLQEKHRAAIKKTKEKLADLKEEEQKARAANPKSRLAEIRSYELRAQAVRNLKNQLSLLNQKQEDEGLASSNAVTRTLRLFQRYPGLLQRIMVGAAGAAAAFAAWKLARLITDSTAFAIKIERIEASFKALSGSAEDARQVVDLSFELSQKIPVNPQKLMEGARSMMAVGASVQDLQTDLKTLAIVATAVNQPADQLAVIYGEIRNKNRLYREDVLQFSRRGIPLMQELQNMFKVTRGELDKMVSEGAVKFAHFQQAMNNMTSSTGRFGNVASDIMDTASGRAQRFESALMKAKEQTGLLILESEGFGKVLQALETASEYANAYAESLRKAREAKDKLVKDGSSMMVDKSLRVDGVDLSDIGDTETRSLEQAGRTLQALYRRRTMIEAQLARTKDKYAAEHLQFQLDAINQYVDTQEKAVSSMKPPTQTLDFDNLADIKAKESLEKEILEILEGQLTAEEKLERKIRQTNELFDGWIKELEGVEDSEAAILKKEEQRKIALENITKEKKKNVLGMEQELQNQFLLSAGWETEINQKVRLQQIEKGWDDAQANRVRALLESLAAYKEQESVAKSLQSKEESRAQTLKDIALDMNTGIDGFSGIVQSIQDVKDAADQADLPLQKVRDKMREMVIEAFNLNQAAEAYSSQSFDAKSFASNIQTSVLSRDKQEVILPQAVLDILEGIRKGTEATEPGMAKIAKILEQQERAARAGR